MTGCVAAQVTVCGVSCDTGQRGGDRARGVCVSRASLSAEDFAVDDVLGVVAGVCDGVEPGVGDRFDGESDARGIADAAAGRLAAT